MGFCKVFVVGEGHLYCYEKQRPKNCTYMDSMLTVPQCGKALSYTVSYNLVTSLKTPHKEMGRQHSCSAPTILAAKRKWEKMKVTKGFSTGDIIQM
jgi:hypothetical protein